MDWQIRIALIVVGILIIGYIVFDYQRRKKEQKEKQRLINQMRQTAEQVDSAGFDFTGVGNVRKSESESVSNDKSESTIKENDKEELAESSHIKVKHHSQKTLDNDATQDSSFKVDTQESSVSTKITEDVAEKRKVKSAPTEQISLDVSSQSAEITQPDLVFSLILKSQNEDGFLGRDFMPLLLSQGLRHGDMGIFHRHAGVSGKPGPIMYSVANAIKPGTFELNNIETFQTPAFAFFMTVPGPNDPLSAYENMVKTVRLLKDELGGQILDDSKSVYTEQTHQHQVDKLREYLTKASIIQ
ncbi:cell division protein ZipA [Aliikangiella sp. IMCC44359]|uniref:cell division protein ZipA n=1 Tax=Aliikangiella sp. IMCC44359 TaxID=3459125 RepID=UPI00403AF7DD